MNTEVAVTTKEPLSIIQDMATRFGMDKKAFESTIRQTCMPSNTQVSNEQFVAFLLVAKQYNLNPITKEIYAFPSKGAIQPIVGIDGWCNIINSQGQLDGIEFEDKLENGKLVAITCRISRKDRAKPIETTEYMEECRRATQPWQQWPARMLRHKALIQCARYAFSLSGIMEPDEAERMVDVTPPPADIRPAELDKTKTLSPFKTATLRNTFHKNMKESLEKARNKQELEDIWTLNASKISDMEKSGDERDQLAVYDLEQFKVILESRLATVTDADDRAPLPEDPDAAVSAYIREQDDHMRNIA